MRRESRGRLDMPLSAREAAGRMGFTEVVVDWGSVEGASEGTPSTSAIILVSEYSRSR